MTHVRAQETVVKAAVSVAVGYTVVIASVGSYIVEPWSAILLSVFGGWALGVGVLLYGVYRRFPLTRVRVALAVCSVASVLPICEIALIALA